MTKTRWSAPQPGETRPTANAIATTATRTRGKTPGGSIKFGKLIAEKWSIICDGPSMRECLSQIDMESKIIAVNHAMTASRTVRVDVFAMFDSPNTFPERGDQKHNLTYLMQFFQPGMRIWAPTRRAESWNLMKKNGGFLCGFEPEPIFEFSEWTDPFHALGKEKPRHEALSPNLTVTLALRGAIANGAKTIDIYGCDMDGVGNALSGVTKNSTQSAKRWKKEERMMKAIMDLCRTVGIEVRRILPDGIITADGKTGTPRTPSSDPF